MTKITTLKIARISRRVGLIMDAIRRFEEKWGSSDSGNLISIEKTIVANVENIECYPEDYRYFLENVGTLDIGTNGYRALVTVAPRSIDSLQKDVDGERYDEELGTLWGYTTEQHSNLLLIASTPCDYETLAFDPTTEPYSLALLDETYQYQDFLEFIEELFRTNDSLARFYRG